MQKTKKEYKDFGKKFAALAKRNARIIIACHKSPDDDAIGSLLSMYDFLKEKYPDKYISMVISGQPRNRWEYFAGSNEINFVHDLAERLSEADLLILLDGSEYSRFTEAPEKVANFEGEIICLDHHGSPPDKFALSLIDTGATSVCEMIYKIFYDSRPTIKKEVAETMLLGILGDTGRFEYINAENSGVFLTAERLVREGDISIQKMRAEYSSYEEKDLEVLREYMNSIKIVKDIGNWPPLAVISISRKALEGKNYTDAEGSNGKNIVTGLFATRIKESPWGIIFQPVTDGGVKFSFRSRPGGPNVRVIAEALGVGGGHDHASGGKFKKDEVTMEASDALKILTDWMRENKAVII